MRFNGRSAGVFLKHFLVGSVRAHQFLFVKRVSLILLLSWLSATAEPELLDELLLEAASTTTTLASVDESREQLALTPGAVEVIDAERFLKGRASTLSDTLALSPGVFAQPRFGSDEARISIRGSGLQRTFHGRGIRVLQDGVPINLADGGFDMQAIEPAAISHMEVWRGANALAHGGSTLGGAIGYISRSGQTSPGYFLRSEGGSWDYFRFTLGGGFATERHDGYGSITEAYQHGFRDHSEQNNQRLFTNVGWLVADHLETRLFLTAIHSESELPGSLTKGELKRHPRRASGVAIAQDQQRNFDLFRIASKTSLAVDEGRWDFTAAWSYKDLDHPIYQVIDQLSNDFILGVSYAYSSEWQSVTSIFALGPHSPKGKLRQRTSKTSVASGG